MREAPQAYNRYFIIILRIFLAFSTIYSGIEAIENELMMLEEVQNGQVDSGVPIRNNIVCLLDCVQKEDRTSLIFELLEGSNFIDDLPKFTELNVARYMRELFIALAHIHRCK